MRIFHCCDFINNLAPEIIGWPFNASQVLPAIQESFDKKPLVVILLGLVCLLIVFSLILFCYIIYSRLKFAAIKRKRKQNYALWEEKLFSILGQDEDSGDSGGASIGSDSGWKKKLYSTLNQNFDPSILLRSVNKNDLEMFAEFLSPYAKDLKGKDLQTISDIFWKSGLLKREMHCLNHSYFNWRRSLAAYRLGNMLAEEAGEELIKALNDKDPTVSLNAAAALMKIGNKEMLKETISKLLKSELLTEELFAEILLGYGKPIGAELLDTLDLDHQSPLSRMKIIDFIGYFNRFEGIPVLIDLLNKTSDTEETIHLVKALGNLGAVEATHHMIDFLENEHPVIRSQAARALGRIKDEETIDQLAKLLEDKDWWCRNHAATAIYNMGKKGIAFLEELRKTTKDSFARDMITQVLTQS